MFKEDVIQKVSQFKKQYLVDKAVEHDIAERFPAKLLSQLIADTNLFELIVSEETAVGMRTFLESIRILSKEFASLSSIVLTQGIYVIWMLHQFGTREQKERYLNRLVSGAMIGAFAFSEQDISLQTTPPQTTAREIDGGWVLDGKKHMVSNATEAGIFFVFAQTIPKEGLKGTGVFMIESETPGLKVGTAISKSGMRALPLAPVSLKNVVLSSDSFLGDGCQEGLSYLSQVLVKMRLAISAQAIGIAEGVFQKGLAFSILKRGFGGRLMDVSVNQFKFAEMQTKLVACEAVYHEYIKTEMIDQRQVAILKLMTTATAQDIADEVVRIIGTYSFMEDNDLERYVNDAKVTGLYGGATDSLKRSVAQIWL